MKEVYGIVINCSKYKDYDAIIDILTEDNVFPIWVRGAYKPNSKYSNYLPIFTRGKFEVYQGGYKYFKLRDAAVDNTLLAFHNDNYSLLYYSMMEELFKKTYSPDISDRFYSLLNESLNEVNNHIDISAVALAYIGNLIKIIGYGINVDQHEDAFGLDFSNGRLVSKNNFNEEATISLSENEVELIYKLFKFSQSEVALEAHDIKTNNHLIEILCNFIAYYNSIEIDSLTYLKYLENTLIMG